MPWFWFPWFSLKLILNAGSCIDQASQKLPTITIRSSAIISKAGRSLLDASPRTTNTRPPFPQRSPPPQIIKPFAARLSQPSASHHQKSPERQDLLKKSEPLQIFIFDDLRWFVSLESQTLCSWLSLSNNPLILSSKKCPIFPITQS